MKKGIIYQNIILGGFVILFCLLALKTEASDIGGANISSITTESYHVMLLFDKSGSMNITNGEDDLAKSAACQFVDQMCNTYSDLAVTTHVGVMSFAQTTQLVSTPIQLDNEANTNYLKAAINGIEYVKRNRGGTDLGKAVYGAVQELQKQASENNKNMVVIFTDGYSENVLDEQESKRNLEDALNIAKDLECEIYIVGLNYKDNQEDNIKPEGRDEIHYIADTAQIREGIISADEDDKYTQWERVNYLITNNINDVREFYGKVYAQMIGSKLEFIEDHCFSVVSDSVVEVNVTIYSESEILNITVKDPDGNERTENGRNFFVSGDSYYKVIRILEPPLGEWIVTAVTANESYNSFVVQFYGIELAIQATWGEPKEFQNCDVDGPYVGQVVVTPMYKGEIYEGTELENNITTARVIVRNDLQSETYLLRYNNEERRFESYFPVHTGEYNLIAELSGESINRSIECGLYVNIPGEEKIDKEITDKNDVNMSENAQLIGKMRDWVIAVVIIVVTVIVIVLVMVLTLLKVQKTAYIRGEFKILAEDLQEGSRIPGNVSRYPHRKKFSVWKLVQDMIEKEEACENISKENKALLNLIRQERKEISKLYIESRNGYGSRKNRKVYKLHREKTVYEISREIVCYDTGILRISIMFCADTGTLDEEI